MTVYGAEVSEPGVPGDYVFGALRAGASGFLLKDSPPADIVQAVRLVAAGDAMLSPAITRSLIDHYAADTAAARAAAAADCLRVLTGREKESRRRSGAAGPTLRSLGCST